MSAFVKKIALGSGTHYGVGFVRTTLCGQLGFLLNLGIRKKEKTDATPVREQSEDLAALFGDNGLPKPQEYDADVLCEGMAAAYVLAVRQARKPDPRTGRINERMANYVTEPRHWIERTAQYDLERATMQVKAQAELLAKDGKAVDVTKRLETIAAETKARADALIVPISKAFALYVKGFVETEDSVLVETAMDAYKLHNRDIRKEMRDGANRIIDTQRKLFNSGERFVEVDPTIYALASETDPAEPVDTPIVPLTEGDTPAMA